MTEPIQTRADLSHVPPTYDQIREKFAGKLDDGTPYMATWYPQMGGYVGKCWIVAACWSGPGADGKHEDAPGFDAIVFHDGEFPFGDDRCAVELHHCSAEQFIEFGEIALMFLAPQVEVRDDD